ncbi:MAG: DUF2149 domain-containing protein [Syntrophomonadaceae bacterium]|jgi:hypothetical protein
MGPGLRKTSRWRNEDINPLEGAINIVDAMLVFACGLMLALAINWNVDLGLGQRVNLEQGQAIDNPQIRENLIETQGEGKLYERMGTVYKDPATGELFMLTD